MISSSKPSQDYLTKNKGTLLGPSRIHHGITEGNQYPPTKSGKRSKGHCTCSKKSNPRTQPTIATPSRTGRGNSLRTRRRCRGNPPASRRTPCPWRRRGSPHTSHRIRDRRGRPPFSLHQLSTYTSRRRLLFKASPQHTRHHRLQKQRPTWFRTKLIFCQSIPQSPIFVVVIIIRE